MRQTISCVACAMVARNTNKRERTGAAILARPLTVGVTNIAAKAFGGIMRAGWCKLKASLKAFNETAKLLVQGLFDQIGPLCPCMMMMTIIQRVGNSATL